MGIVYYTILTDCCDSDIEMGHITGNIDVTKSPEGVIK